MATSLRNVGNSVYPALPVYFGGDTKSCRSLLPGVDARGSRPEISQQSALEICNLSWNPHSNLEKDNSLNHVYMLAQRLAVWSITKLDWENWCEVLHGQLIVIPDGTAEEEEY